MYIYNFNAGQKAKLILDKYKYTAQYITVTNNTSIIQSDMWV